MSAADKITERAIKQLGTAYRYMMASYKQAKDYIITTGDCANIYSYERLCRQFLKDLEKFETKEKVISDLGYDMNAIWDSIVE